MTQQYMNIRQKQLLRIGGAALLLLFLLIVLPVTSYAGCCPCQGCSCVNNQHDVTRELVVCEHNGEGESVATATISETTMTTPVPASAAENTCANLLNNTTPTSLLPQNVREQISGATGLDLNSSDLSTLGASGSGVQNIQQQFEQMSQDYLQNVCGISGAETATGTEEACANNNPYALNEAERQMLANCGNPSECSPMDQITEQILAERAVVINNCERPDELINDQAIIDLFNLPEELIFIFTQRAAGFEPAKCEGHPALKPHITDEFKEYQIWIVDDFFREHVLPALMMMTEQLVTVGMQQVLAIGTFFDAKQQLETQLVLQRLEAEAHQDYQSSVGMCTFGTLARSLAASEQNGVMNTVVLSQQSIHRQLGINKSAGSKGFEEDRTIRLQEFKNTFCDTKMGRLDELCTASANAKMSNSDADFGKFLNHMRSVEIDFSDGSVSDDEKIITALGRNLFAHRITNRFTASEVDSQARIAEFQKLRALVAKRSVAENSFYSIVGLKAAGATESAETADYMKAVMKQMGVTNTNELKEFVGDRPSYMAQLEFLGQHVYQQPDFYTNLYGHPEDVIRKEISMQAINLMLDRTMHKSELRSEMNLAVILEIELSHLQQEAVSNLEQLEDEYKE